jgi:hypothetical protein
VLGSDTVTVAVNVTAATQAFHVGATGRSLPAWGWMVEPA